KPRPGPSREILISEYSVGGRPVISTPKILAVRAHPFSASISSSSTWLYNTSRITAETATEALISPSPETTTSKTTNQVRSGMACGEPDMPGYKYPRTRSLNVRVSTLGEALVGTSPLLSLLSAVAGLVTHCLLLPWTLEMWLKMCH